MSLIKKVLMLSSVLVGLAYAGNDIQLRMLVQQEVRVETSDGRAEYRLIDAGTVLPGDEIVYTIFFKNNGSQAATDIVIDDPIPPQTVLKEGSVFGAGTEISYSVDGGKQFAPPAQLEIEVDGVKRPATSIDYTHIRWVFKGQLDAGKEGMVGFRAQLK